jgi:hypothetical protein
LWKRLKGDVRGKTNLQGEEDFFVVVVVVVVKCKDRFQSLSNLLRSSAVDHDHHRLSQYHHSSDHDYR